MGSTDGYKMAFEIMLTKAEEGLGYLPMTFLAQATPCGVSDRSCA